MINMLRVSYRFHQLNIFSYSQLSSYSFWLSELSTTDYRPPKLLTTNTTDYQYYQLPKLPATQNSHLPASRTTVHRNYRLPKLPTIKLLAAETAGYPKLLATEITGYRNYRLPSLQLPKLPAAETTCYQNYLLQFTAFGSTALRTFNF